MTRIGFIGLGRMGAGMAANLVKAGRDVRAFDLSQDAVDRAVAAGCRASRTAADAASEAEVVITMLPAARHVKEVVLGSLFKSAPKGALLIDCSTIDVQTARDMAAAARADGRALADAPVSGGVMAADAGALTFMVGCDADDFDRVEAALQPMARAVIRAGGPGSGQAAKICNNMVLGVSMLGVCEAFALAERLGLAPEKFYDIATRSSGQCWSLSAYCPWPGVGPETPADHDYEGGFLTSLMLKDLKLAQEAAAASGAATPLGAQAEAIYALLDRLGYGGKDFSSALQLLRGRAAPAGAPE